MLEILTQTDCLLPQTVLNLCVMCKYSHIGVFANDNNDHCVVAAVTQLNLPKPRPQIFHKQDFKDFCEQAFFHELRDYRWNTIYLISDVELA